LIQARVYHIQATASMAARFLACVFSIMMMPADALRVLRSTIGFARTEGALFTFKGCSEQAVNDIQTLEENLPRGSREGGTDPREYKWEQALVNEVQAKRICQTGFNTGISALAFLCAGKDTLVYSYDLGVHDYVKPQSTQIMNIFPGRHELFLGDSTKTLPNAIRQSNVSCDLSFVDGGHSYEVALADIRNFAKLTKPGGRLLVENCNADQISRGFGGIKAVNDAYQTALKTGTVIHEGQVSTGCGSHYKGQECREICVGHFQFHK